MSMFNMDDIADQVDRLNYRLVDSDMDPDPADPFTPGLHPTRSSPVFDDSDPEPDDTDDYIVTDYAGADVTRLDIPRRTSARRGSHSVDLRINEPFISSSPTLDDFEPIMVLGKGTYGKVLLVRQKTTGKLFAQKQLKKISLLMNNEVNEVNLERTLNEKKILERVNHPNIVKLYYAFQDFNKVYLILEYLDGGELFYHLSQESFLPESKACFYIAQLVLALRYLHLQLHVIYRDLKPENCMLDSSGSLVLTDFGLSKVSDKDKTNSFIGTIQYMAPEILRNENYSYEVDWWSLGCISFDLLTGSPPFTGNNNKKITEKILASKKNLKFPFYLSLDAKDFLRKLLAVNIDKRINLDQDDQFEAIKKHRFFRHINWDDLIHNNQAVLPPILPVITNPLLAENFDKEFTEMAFTPPMTKSNEDILHVNGFTFTNEKFLNSYVLK
ncbi:Pkinase-domain-containing protein [Yamadazyma tenuis ATCC 10573]|uniref:Pkinase-domain-containing protein n=1 Tax=Candida tenuis (strain ATCC 10573 / BCRC 21748 / CBS 615 / JCM 9827 / NBRC 10315 / NRRL Y-1498 / VKM Y-70) TaxID=590646 RepID=G3AX33_CANTC|nr:Pkinase-domain-containing protein [Yamadazyma tenuis ATCC 10573]EGV66678.1 Pkinase-domain-containing protein [Yamadazyma tenuis ATCC 10573]